MNKDNAKDFLPLVQALMNGKTIQQIGSGSNHWLDVVEPHFYASPNDYRIKPEPREFIGKITETKRTHHSYTRSFTITMEGDLGYLPSLSEKMSLREIL